MKTGSYALCSILMLSLILGQLDAVASEAPLVLNLTSSLKIPEVTSKKLTNKITLKLNRDLFERGLEVETKGYGQYFATLEASNRLDVQFGATPASKVLKRKIRHSSVSGAMRIGGFVTGSSRVYLKVGFESENFGASNTLKTRTLDSCNQGYWRTVMASGVGFEYGVSQKWSVLGEATTMALSVPLGNKALSTNHVTPAKPNEDGDDSSSNSSSKFQSRDNRLLVGLRYRFGG